MDNNATSDTMEELSKLLVTTGGAPVIANKTLSTDPISFLRQCLEKSDGDPEFWQLLGKYTGAMHAIGATLIALRRDHPDDQTTIDALFSALQDPTAELPFELQSLS